MRLLLDSHVVLQTMIAHPRLSKKALVAITDPRNEVFVSAATPYELEWKKANSKLQFRHVADWSHALQAAGYRELAITLHHSHQAALLPANHRDPWDRILVAQALSESLTLVTSDGKMGAYSAPILW